MSASVHGLSRYVSRRQAVTAADPAKVRYQLANLDEGFVIARSEQAAEQALGRMLERHRTTGNRVRRRLGQGGRAEYVVTTPQHEPIARYWLDSGASCAA